MSLPAREIRDQVRSGRGYRLRYQERSQFGAVGSDERVFEVTLTSDEAKRVAYALLLAADGIKPLA